MKNSPRRDPSYRHGKDYRDEAITKVAPHPALARHLPFKGKALQ